MKSQYLIRLDDACPSMDSIKWGRMEELLESYSIRPMVGIVPNCRDEHLKCQKNDPFFWDKVHIWEEKKWSLAMHGYDHCYISDKGMDGVNPMWKRSEFAGVGIDVQREKIRKGMSIFREHGVKVNYFFAPSHTFDKETLFALNEETDIRVISDTIGRYPYKYLDFWFIPQITGHCVNMRIPGIYTFCFHPNTMEDIAFNKLEQFLNQYSSNFISFDEIDLSKYGRKKFLDKILSWLFFRYRKVRGYK